MIHFDWVEFYSEFATKLLLFRNNRQVLIEKIQKVYLNINMKFPKMESDSILVDIDPFSIFGMFNKGITNANRITIITGIAAEFGLVAKVPDSFDGIPVLNNLKATFFYFKDERGENDIENLWKVFEAALTLADHDTQENRNVFADVYNIVLQQQGIRWNITMGLYWIRPYAFLNLDSRNRWYISNPENMPADFVAKIQGRLEKVPSASWYLEICDACKEVIALSIYEYTNFPELSYDAWKLSEQINQQSKAEISNGVVSKAAFLHWMNPLLKALKDLRGSATPQEARKRIIENEHLSEEEIKATRGKNNVNKFENEVAFARNYLVYAGYIDKSIYGVWTLTEQGKTVDMTDELAAAIFKKGMANNQSKRESAGAALADDNVDTAHYWMYAPGSDAKKWEEFYIAGIMGLGWEELGNLEAYATKEEMRQKMQEIYDDNSSMKNSAHATWQFCHEVKVGDFVFVKKGRSEILGRGIVTSDYEYSEEREDYNHIHHVAWTHKGNWQLENQTALKTLTDITPYTDMIAKVNALFEEESVVDDEPKIKMNYPKYTVDSFLEEVYMEEDDYNKLVSIMRNKKNIILQGAPGVGKTYAAKRLAYSIMGLKDIERVMMVQFHQSYSYEDFITGYRPSANGFELKKGAFYNFCKKAEIDTDNEYFFIIDEINRGNLSKIFGELFMLIENDKRGISLQLLYSDEKFAVPENVYIIGMMNTADRSLAMLDYALRRRFAFIEMKPGFDTAGFRSYRMALDNPKMDRLINCVSNLNTTIAADESLGDGFCIGHSYFCNLTSRTVNEQSLSSIVEYELIPLLKEYWFDEPNKLRDWSSNLRSAIK